MRLTPLPGYALIEPFDEEEKTASGLVMPEKAKEKPAKGKVMAIGGAIKVEGELMKCPVKKGDTVIHHRWAGQDAREGQKEYKLVKFADLMGVYK